ncbi:MAG: hypothetical protein ACO1HP_02575 [Bacteroidota bacterium]|jgi:hypothetical protein
METFITEKGSAIKVKGSTIIDHRIQAKLGISLLEYVLIDFAINNLDNQTSSRLLDTKGLYLPQGELELNLEHLVDQNILVLDGHIYKAGKRWNEHFANETDFDCKDPNNPGFWQIMKQRGNKEKGRQAYMNARKVVDKETLHSAAIRYVASKDDPAFIMHVSTYCNPKYRHWEDQIINPTKHGKQDTAGKINELAREIVSRRQDSKDDDF